jgi:hypothetical protein
MTQEEKTLFEKHTAYFDGVFTGIELMGLESTTLMLRIQVQNYYLLSLEEVIKMPEEVIRTRWALIHFAKLEEEVMRGNDTLKKQALDEFLEGSILHLVSL